MKKFTLTLLIGILSVTAFAQTTTASKTEKIKQLLEITGSAKLGAQVAKNMMNVFQQSYTNVDKKFWEEFEKEIKRMTWSNY